jgi:hypothetical protein
MAGDFDTPHVNVTGTYTGVDQKTGEHQYTFTNNETNAEATALSSYAPDDTTDNSGKVVPGFINILNSLGTPAGEELAFTLAPTFRQLQTQDQRNFLARGIAPIVRSLFGGPYLFGGGPDILGLLSYIPGPDELVAMGYEAITGETPGFLEAGREGAKKFRETVAEPYGHKSQQKRFERYLRQADAYAEDKWGFRPFSDFWLSPVGLIGGTDMTPEARGFLEKTITTGLEFGVSGVPMVKGVTLPLKGVQTLIRGAEQTFKKLARESVEELGEAATRPDNVRTLIDKANDFYSLGLPSGRRNVRGDVAFGVGAGVSTEVALNRLEAVDPDAAGWVKATTAIASGIIVPVAVRGAFTSLIQAPVVYRFITEGIFDPVFRPGTSAKRFTQRHGLGPTEANKVEIAGVGRILEEAFARGRHVHQASGLAFTTPELARSEANILRERTLIKRDELADATDPAVKERLAKEIAEAESQVSSLVRYANFQEDILTAAARDKAPGAAAKFFDAEANRLVERREQFFNYVENQFKQSFDDINFNGKPGGTPAQHRRDLELAEKGAIPEFETTRRNLVMRGDLKGIEAAELQWLTPSARSQADNAFEALDTNLEKSFNDAKTAAEGRVKFWKKGVDDYLAAKGLKTVDDLSATEKTFVGDLIRGTYDDASREMRGFERAAYRRVAGMDEKVTENIVFPKGAVDPVTGDSIVGMEISDWAADRLENLTRSQKFNPRDVPAELVQLTGMRSLIALLNRQQKEAVAAGRAVQAEARIPDLERIRDDAITKRQQVEDQIKTQLATDRKAAEQQTRSLQTYVEGATTKLDDTQTSAVNTFFDDPDIVWERLTLQMARDQAPKGLEPIFASIASQKKKIAELGEGTLVSKEIDSLNKDLLKITAEATDAQAQINKITGSFLEGMDAAPIAPTGRLTSRNAEGELVAGGTSPEDVKVTISDVAEAASREHRINGKTPKYRDLIQLRTTLEQLLTPAVFKNLDGPSLSFAREVSQLKHRVSEAQGDILARDRGVKVQFEQVAEKVLPEQAAVTGQAANLRLLQTATADVPPFVTIKRDANGRIVTNAEGTPLAVIDESALTGESLFNLPDSPFEKVLVGEAGFGPLGGFSEIRLRPNAPVTDRSLKIAESILLERLALQFPEGVDSKTLASFRSKNKRAIKFLKDNGRDAVPDLVNNADVLATQLDALNSLFKGKTRRQLKELVDSGSLDLGGTTIDDYLEYIGQRRQNIGYENAFANVLEADPGRATNSLFERILNPQNNRPKKDLQEFLSVVRENQAAEKGFKASVIGELWRRSTTWTDDFARATGDLSARAFDPVLFRELMGDPKIRMLLQEVFPDNKAFLDGLDKMAAVAFETANFTKGSRSLATAIDPQTALSLEAYSNLGRIAGLNVAARIDFLNSLVLAGVGGRYGAKLGRSLTGSKIKDILVIAALDVSKGIELSKATSKHVDGFLATLRKAAIDTVAAPVAVPMRRPAATVPILLRGQEELDEETRFGPQSSREPPIGPPTLASRTPPAPPRPPVAGSTLAQARPLDPLQFAAAAPPTGAPRPETLAGLAEVGLPLFPAFANKGGLASLKKKKKSRQMVY